MIETLQSLRFVFVMLIFLSHFAYKDIETFDAGGDCGVAFFFLLSGFVCALGYGQSLRDGTFCYRTFLWRRLKKLYPLHLLCLLFVLMVSRPALDFRVLANVLLLQSWVPNADWYFGCNSVAWFLSSLMFCYVVFPWAYRHLSVWLTLAVGVALVAVYWLTPYDWVNAVLYVNPAVRFVDFYIGMLLCQWYERRRSADVPAWAEWLAVGGVLAMLAVYPHVDAKLRTAPLFWVVLVPLLFVFIGPKGWLSRQLRTRAMLFLGTLTMPLFLTHQLLLSILLRRLPDMPAVVMLAACVALALTLSWFVQIIFSRFLRL